MKSTLVIILLISVSGLLYAQNNFEQLQAQVKYKPWVESLPADYRVSENYSSSGESFTLLSFFSVQKYYSSSINLPEPVKQVKVGKNALIGALIGAGIGSITGALTYENKNNFIINNAGDQALLIGAVGGLIGSGLGAVIAIAENEKYIEEKYK